MRFHYILNPPRIIDIVSIEFVVQLYVYLYYKTPNKKQISVILIMISLSDNHFTSSFKRMPLFVYNK